MDPNAVTRFAADGILNSLLAGVAIAMLAWVVARLFSRQGSGTCFAVWFLALVAIGLLPFVGHFAGASTAAAKVAPSSAITLPPSFASYLFVAWVIGATLGLSHVAHGLYRLRRLRTTCTPVDLNRLGPVSRDILAETQTPRRITLCASDAVRVPAAIGYFRPMVVFPTWTLSELSPAELNAILLHELAHLRRWDDFTNLGQKIVKAIFFFHPAVWFIESRLTLEREMACDDAVLAASISPRAYAESLVGLAEKSFLRRGVQLAQAAVSQVKQLKLRLAEILRPDKARSQPRSARVWKPAVAVMSLVGIVSAYGFAHVPRLIAFSSTTPQLATSSIDVRSLSQSAEVHLQPVNLNYTVSDTTATPVPDVAKVHKSMKPQTGKSRAKNNQLRVFRVSMVNSTERMSNLKFGVPADAPPPTLLLSRLPIELSSAPVLVVFQGQQFGPDGPIFWWRVTIVHLTPGQHRAITGGIAKQI